MKNQTNGLKLSNEESNRITKDSIQEALVYLLSKKTMDEISVTEIVNKAGVSRTAYYRNYQSKEEILKDFSHNVFELIFSQLSDPDLVKDGQTWYYFIFNQVKINERIIRLLIKAKNYSLIQFLPKIDESLYDKKQLYQIHAMESALISLIEKWVANDFDLTVDEISSLCFELFPYLNFFIKE